MPITHELVPLLNGFVDCHCVNWESCVTQIQYRIIILNQTIEIILSLLLRTRLIVMGYDFNRLIFHNWFDIHRASLLLWLMILTSHEEVSL